MSTTNTCKKCGCQDSFMPSPAPCPTPVGCPTPQPCSEIFDAQCVRYTGTNILCDTDIVVNSNDTLAEALESIADYFCSNGGGGTGAQGPQGIQGVAGPTGPQGIAGSAGAAGTTGATGPQGIQGIAGPIGPAGLNWQGVWSASGVYVADDAVGFGGASWFCINPTGPNVLSPDLDPTNWALLASEGATGPAGPTGAAGVAGAAGATGPQGPAGSIGLTGTQGIQGIQGIQGPIGPAGGVTQIIAGTNVTISPVGGTGAVTINSSGGGGSQFNYEIGQYVVSEGGVIVHRWLSTLPNGTPTAGTTQNYIVVDLNNLSSSAQWASLNVNIPNVESTFDGEVNTSNLIIAGTGSGITVGTAAQLCDVSTNAGLTDWYLPAIDELSKLWQNRWDVAQGINLATGTQLAFDNYWSSTESGASNAAWHFNFSNAIPTTSSKASTFSVRAVRRFSI